MKKKLFEQFDEQFVILCEYPSCEQRDYVMAVLNFLFLSLVINASQYQFLCHSVYAIL